jgi:hypothetical protein
MRLRTKKKNRSRRKISALSECMRCTGAGKKDNSHYLSSGLTVAILSYGGL